MQPTVEFGRDFVSRTSLYQPLMYAHKTEADTTVPVPYLSNTFVGGVSDNGSADKEFRGKVADISELL